MIDREPTRRRALAAVVGSPVGRFVTQMYVEGEPGNARDGVLNAIRDPAARGSVIVKLGRGSAGLAARFDIVLAV